MDKLSHMICNSLEDGNWIGMKPRKLGTIISHLMFVDDILLFGKATEKQMECTMEVLHNFCSSSGKRISHDKSCILFSNDTKMHIMEKLLAMSNFKEVNSLGTYLGIPLIGRCPKLNDYRFLQDKIKTKLARWKGKQLSFAGHATLAKSVIEAIICIL